MPTLNELKIGLIAADKVGDVRSAAVLANAIRNYQQVPSVIEEPTVQPSDFQQPGFLETLGESFTGEARSTKETEILPGIGELPELNQLSVPSYKSAVLSLFTDQEEYLRGLKSNFPNVQIRSDKKGNPIIRSSIDGKEYAIKPGFTPTDLLRVGATMAAFTPAGKATTLLGATAAGAGTQAAIEGVQELTGGQADIEDVALAGVLGIGGQFVSRGLTGIKESAQQLFRRFRGDTAPLTTEDVAEVTRKAVFGGEEQARELAVTVDPSKKIVKAATRLGVLEDLTPAQITKSHSFREIYQGIASKPGSELRVKELESFKAVSQKADEIIERYGTTDLAMLDQRLKNEMISAKTGMEDVAKELYGSLSEKIPPTTPSAATNVLNFINEQVVNLGGKENLSQIEKNLLKSLSPKDILDETKKVVGIKQPTYQLLDKKRKEIIASLYKKQGPFKDATTGELKLYSGLLTRDQRTIVEQMGQLPLFEQAQSVVKSRKILENKMVDLFGKNLDGSMLGELSTSIKQVSKGDVSKFTKFVSAVPDDMRENVVSSGLAEVFGKNIRNNNMNFTTYANWYESLKKHDAAFSAVMSNLPKGSVKKLKDLYKVSKGISKASKERITTGRVAEIRVMLEGGDNLIEQVYKTAVKSSVAGIAATLGSTKGGLATGAIMALTPDKSRLMSAADNLIADPAFTGLILNAGSSQRANKLLGTDVFKSFAKALGNPTELSKLERFILSLGQATKTDILPSPQR